MWRGGMSRAALRRSRSRTARWRSARKAVRLSRSVPLPSPPNNRGNDNTDQQEKTERFMSKHFILTGLAVLMLSAGPSAACDPEEMIKELRAQCEDAVKAAVQLIEPVKLDLTEGERSTVDLRVKQAGTLCNDDKYTDGYAV